MKKRGLILAAAAVLLVAATLVLLPVLDVNVIFARCMNADELATALGGTSFRTSQIYSVSDDSAQLTIKGAGSILGTPLEGGALEAALAAQPRGSGVAILDGKASLLDMVRIEASPFVDDVRLYAAIGDRDVLPQSVLRFFEINPQARYWE